MSAPFSYEPQGSYTWEQYLALEAQSEERYEYHDGRIVAMAGGSLRHGEIVLNVATRLKGRGSGCKVYAESAKLFRHQSKAYFYPDIALTCNPLDLQSNSGIKNPLLVVEVLSDSTAKSDQGFKLQEYIRIPSLRHYLLVAQEDCCVMHYFRTNSTGLWTLQIFTEMENVIDLPEVGMQLTLAQMYEGVRFGSETLLLEEEAALYGTDLPQN